uniref:Hypothetical phage tail region protein n=1 Tax=Saprospira sp. SS98-5 TaxID=202748 RepID=B1B708_9BACT|nr:hypothetical phage tail region protein [Saprospira sp. SS98-5]
MPELPASTPLPNLGSDYPDWPLSKFAFQVSIGGFDGNVAFQGLDGLGASIASMKFRDGNSPNFFEQSRPTLTSYEPVTLKKGVFTGDTTLFNWFSNVSKGALFSDMRTVTISLSELTGNGLVNMFTWTLERAYVTKFTPSGLDAESDGEVAIEEIELNYQYFTMDAQAGLLGMLGGLASAAVGGIAGSIGF